MPLTRDYDFEERAAIMEYDGGLTRLEAERETWHIFYGYLLAQIEMFHERAAIIEYDGGLEREDAERHAAELVYNREVRDGRGRKQKVQGIRRSHVRLRG